MRATRTVFLLLAAWAGPAAAADPARADLDHRFADTIRPFLQTYCLGCHSHEKPKGDLDLSAFAGVEAVAGDLRRWGTVLDQLRAGTMPPVKAKAYPTAEARQAVVAWATDVRKYEGKRTAGDPGPVPARRLSNAEYDHTIR